MTEWLNSIVGEAIGPYAAIMIALIIVFALIAVLFRAWRAFSSGSFGRNNQHRLGILEASAVDAKRRLVLVRRDNVEHLILIGGPSDIVVEQNITRSKASTTRQPAQNAPVASPQAPQQAANTQPTHVEQAKIESPAAQPAPAPASAPAPVSATTSASPASPPAVAPVQQAQPHQSKPQIVQAAPTPTSVMAKPDTPPMTTPVANTPNVAVPAQSANDSAKVGDEMDRLLNQIAGDIKK